MSARIECGCEIFSSIPDGFPTEIRFCVLHGSARAMQETLVEIRDTLEARAHKHLCMGYHCSECAPTELSEKANDAVRLSMGLSDGEEDPVREP